MTTVLEGPVGQVGPGCQCGLGSPGGQGGKGRGGSISVKYK